MFEKDEIVNTCINGDALEVLKQMPDAFIDCCITSPPYYGLRDYGTGKWVGGDPNCKHECAQTVFHSKGGTEKQQSNKGAEVSIYKKICPICGAIRVDKQIGLEETPETYIDKLVAVFSEVKRVLKDDGTLWVNIGDSYCGTGSKVEYKDPKYAEGRNGQVKSITQNVEGCKTKDLIGIPWMLAFALRNDGWYLRQEIIWAKPNPMPESVTDRCTKSHESVFLLSKQPHYYFDNEAIKEDAVCKNDRRLGMGRLSYDGKYSKSEDEHTQNFLHITETRNKRDVWTIATKPLKEAHFATYPEKLIEPCILAGSKIGGVVLDPFFGSGTTGRVAKRFNRDFVGIELNADYMEINKKRTENTQLELVGLDCLR